MRLWKSWRVSGILEDLDGFDHRRVDILDAADLQTVDDVQRGEASSVGGVTADADRSAFARCTVGEDVDTGYLALEGRGGVSSRTVLEVFRTDGCHGSGKVALLLDTVTDDDGLLEELGVLFKSKVDDGTSGDGNGLGRITDTGNCDAGLNGDIEIVISVNVSHCSDGGVAHHHDGCTHDGLSILIDYLS